MSLLVDQFMQCRIERHTQPKFDLAVRANNENCDEDDSALYGHGLWVETHAPTLKTY